MDRKGNNRINKINSQKGFASVFLVIIITSVILSSLVIIEAASGYAASSICNNLSAVAGRSVLSEYKTELFKRYGLFALERNELYSENRLEYYLSSSFSSNKALVQIKLNSAEISYVNYNSWNDELCRQISLMSLGLNSYIMSCFSNKLSPLNNTVKTLEAEYIICGLSTDAENAECVRGKIYASRLSMDMASIYKNEKELKVLRIVAKILFPDLAVDAALFTLVSVKAGEMAEKETSQILNGAKLKVISDDGSELYADYKDYILAFLFLVPKDTKLYRMRNLIEDNIINIDNSFFTFTDYSYGFTAVLEFEKKSIAKLFGITKRNKTISMEFCYL